MFRMQNLGDKARGPGGLLSHCPVELLWGWAPGGHVLTSLGLSLLTRGLWSGFRWSTHFSFPFYKKGLE